MEFRSTRQTWLRPGLSFVEFVGCLVAMVGGVVLGSLYLGIDVQTMAVGVLEQAQVVAPGYFDQVVGQPVEVTPDQASASISNGATDVEEAAAATQSVDARAADQSSTATPARVQVKPVARAEPTDAERLAATREYWDQLTACMLQEARGRLRGEGDPQEWELYDYLAQRKSGHEAALEQLEKLKPFGVDERLLGHGDQVIAWHKSGIKLFEHALSLLSDGPGAKLTGPFAQSWQSAATQLRMEENLVVERHRAVANYLDREYAHAAPFVPAFQQ